MTKDCSRALVNLASNEKYQLYLYRLGGLESLYKLTTVENLICKRYAATGVQLLFTNLSIGRQQVQSGSFSNLHDMFQSSLLYHQRSAIASLSCLTLHEENKAPILQSDVSENVLYFCLHSDLQIQRDAAFSLANLATTKEFDQKMSDDTLLSTITKMKKSDTRVCRDIARLLSLISENVTIRDKLLTKDTLGIVSKFSRSEDIATQRYASLTLCNLSLSDEKNIILEYGLLRILSFLGRYPDLEVERCAILSLAALSLGNNHEQRLKIVKSEILQTINDILKYPDQKLQQCACLALNCILLTENDEVKKIALESGVKAIMPLLDSTDEECLHLGLYAIGSFLELPDANNVLIDYDYLTKIIQSIYRGTIESKRAGGYILSVLSQNPEYHDILDRSNCLETVINLASLVDTECQEYGAFALAYLSGNKTFQIKLVKMGAVRPLVTIMATSSESRHYAGLALLKLADNFENHITIAEEGGIQALLRMGKSKITNDEVQYKAALTVGHLAQTKLSRVMDDKRSPKNHKK